MKKVVKEFQVFNFDELSENIQEKVLDKFRESFIDDFWYKDIESEPLQYTKSFYEKMSLKDIELYNFDLYRGYITLKGSFNLLEFLKEFELLTKYNELLPLIDTEDNVSIEVNGSGETNYLELPDFETLKDKELREKLHNDIASILKDLKNELFKSLNSEYNYLMSDEYIKEGINSGEYEFLATGEIFNS
jgi:hypothetical protein